VIESTRRANRRTAPEERVVHADARAAAELVPDGARGNGRRGAVGRVAAGAVESGVEDDDDASVGGSILDARPVLADGHRRRRVVERAGVVRRRRAWRIVQNRVAPRHERETREHSQ
jgi:hypothetical protein